MYLKTLEVFGFKSFPEKTVIHFTNGITAIVGPNGCGKSNISDAIRWVLGEQSPSALRGSEMQDVIFNGCKSRKPLGFTEVLLTLVNSKGGFSLPYNEVVITRRLFRSGESEYLINNMPCRLRDIHDLFYGTGLGRSAYSLIRQGDIELILNSKPRDRREIFDEAAGITKYRVRKEEAIRRLASTDNDLARINDLLIEIERQMNSLHWQAKRARQYLKIRDRIRSLEIDDLKGKYLRLTKEIKEKTKEIQTVSLELERREGKVDSLRQELEKGEANRKEANLKLLQAKDASFQIVQKVQSIENQIARAEERKTHIFDQIDHLKAHIQDLDKRIDLDDKREKEERALQDSVMDEEIRLARSLKLEMEKLKDLTHKCTEAERALDEAKRGAIDLLNEISEIRSCITRLRAEEENRTLRCKRLLSEIEALDEEIRRKEGLYFSLRRRVEDMESEIEALDHEINEGNEEKSLCESTLDGLSGQIQRTREELKTRIGRLHTLDRLEKSLTGYQRTVKQILKADSLFGVYGVIANLVDFPKDLTLCLEAALEENLQTIVVEDKKASDQVIAFVKDVSGERVTIAPLSELKLCSPQPRPIESGEFNTFVGYALDLVQFEDRLRPVFETLLGNCIILKDLSEAEKILKRCTGFWRLISLDGGEVNTLGFVKAGGQRPEEASLFGRKRAIEELRQEVSSLNETMSQLEVKRDREKQRLASYLSVIESKKRQLRKKEAGVLNLERKLAILENEMKINREKLLRLRVEQKEISKEGDRESSKIRSLLDKQIAYAKMNEEREGSISRLKKDVEEKREAVKDKEQELTRIKVALAEAIERRRNSVFRLSALQNERDTLKRERDSTYRKIHQCKGKLATDDRLITKCQTELEELRREGIAMEGALFEIEASCEELDEVIKNKTAVLRNEEKALNELKEDLSSLELERRNLEAQLQQVKERLEKEFKFSDFLKIEEDPPPLLSASNPEDEIEELRRRLDRMGNVNLMAPDEFEQVRKRYEFIQSQKDDLVSAKEDLKNLIRNIERVSKGLFLDVFNQVKENFGRIFSQLFGGGQAKLFLTEEENPLESGIEISVQPPGKRLRSISLLSGGEKALTAIALLFAIFQVKPSPFYLLDEVDASLDEVNTERFIKMLKEYSRTTQFIVITHNKRTIGISDSLCGVTMEEPGVSKLVTVKIEK